MGEQELMMDTAEGERLRRWRLVLGEEAQASCGLAGLSPEDRQMDEALAEQQRQPASILLDQ